MKKALITLLIILLLQINLSIKLSTETHIKAKNFSSNLTPPETHSSTIRRIIDHNIGGYEHYNLRTASVESYLTGKRSITVYLQGTFVKEDTAYLLDSITDEIPFRVNGLVHLIVYNNSSASTFVRFTDLYELDAIKLYVLEEIQDTTNWISIANCTYVSGGTIRYKEAYLNITFNLQGGYYYFFEIKIHNCYKYEADGSSEAYDYAPLILKLMQNGQEKFKKRIFASPGIARISIGTYLSDGEYSLILSTQKYDIDHDGEEEGFLIDFCMISDSSNGNAEKLTLYSRRSPSEPYTSYTHPYDIGLRFIYAPKRNFEFSTMSGLIRSFKVTAWAMVPMKVGIDYWTEEQGGAGPIASKTISSYGRTGYWFTVEVNKNTADWWGDISEDGAVGVGHTVSSTILNIKEVQLSDYDPGLYTIFKLEVMKRDNEILLMSEIEYEYIRCNLRYGDTPLYGSTTLEATLTTDDLRNGAFYTDSDYVTDAKFYYTAIINVNEEANFGNGDSFAGFHASSSETNWLINLTWSFDHVILPNDFSIANACLIIDADNEITITSINAGDYSLPYYYNNNDLILNISDLDDFFRSRKATILIDGVDYKRIISDYCGKVVTASGIEAPANAYYFLASDSFTFSITPNTSANSGFVLFDGSNWKWTNTTQMTRSFDAGEYELYAFADNGKLLFRINLVKKFKVEDIVISNPHITVYPKKTVATWNLGSTTSCSQELVIISGDNEEIVLNDVYEDQEIKIIEVSLDGRILTLATNILAQIRLQKKTSKTTHLKLEFKLEKDHAEYATLIKEYSIQTDSTINIELELSNMILKKPIRGGFYDLVLTIQTDSGEAAKEITSILFIDCDNNVRGRILENGGTDDNVTYALILADAGEVSAWMLEDVPQISETYQGAIVNQSGIFIPWNQVKSKYNDVNISVMASDFDGILGIKAYCNGTELPSTASNVFLLDTKECDENKVYNVTIIVEDNSRVKAVYTRFMKVIPYAPRILGIACNGTDLNNAVLGMDTIAEIQFEEWGSGVKSISVFVTNGSVNVSIPVTTNGNIATFKIPVMDLLDGFHKVYVIINDDAGLSSFKVLTITTDRTYPEIRGIIDITNYPIIAYITFYDEHLDSSSLCISSNASMYYSWVNSTTIYIEFYVYPEEFLSGKGLNVTIADIDGFGRRKYTKLPVILTVTGIASGADHELYALNDSVKLIINALNVDVIVFKDEKSAPVNGTNPLSFTWNIRSYRDGYEISIKIRLISGDNEVTISGYIIKDTAIPTFYAFNVSGGVVNDAVMYFNYQNLTLIVSVKDDAGNLETVLIYANESLLINFTYDGKWQYTTYEWDNSLVEIHYTGDNYWLNATIIYNATLIDEKKYVLRIYAEDMTGQSNSAYTSGIDYVCIDRTPPSLNNINLEPLSSGCYGEFANFSVIGGRWNITVDVSDNFGVKMVTIRTYDVLLNKSLESWSDIPSRFYWQWDSYKNIYSDTFVLVEFIVIDYAGNSAVYRYYLCVENRSTGIIIYANGTELEEDIWQGHIWLGDIEGHTYLKVALLLTGGTNNRSWVRRFYLYLNDCIIVNITVLPDYSLYVYSMTPLLSIEYYDYAHFCELLHYHFYGINTDWFNVTIVLNETYLMPGIYYLSVYRIANHEKLSVDYWFRYKPRTIVNVLNNETWITNPWVAFNITDILGRPLSGSLNISINETNRWGIVDVINGFVNVTLNGTHGTLKVWEIGNYTLIVKYDGDGVSVEKVFRILVWEWNPPYITNVKIKSEYNENEIDGTDHGIVLIEADDNETHVEYAYLNYTVDGGLTWNVINMTYNGTHWNTTLPVFKWNTNVTFRIYLIDHAGNVFVSKYYSYVVVDPYAPIIWWIKNSQNTYAYEEINITAMILENVNGSGFDVILMELYVSDDNATWDYIGAFELNYGSNPKNVTYGTYIGEPEEWNNATLYWITLRFNYATYVRIIMYAYDRAGNEAVKEHYFKVNKRAVKIIAWNITTRYGDNTSIEFQVIDELNDSLISLYYEIWLYTHYPVKLLACGYSNSSGNTTVYLVFNQVKVFKLLIRIVETEAFHETEKIIYVNVTREIMKVHASVSDVEKDNTFHLTAKITDDEGEIIVSGAYEVFIHLEEWIKIKEGEFSSGIINEDITLNIGLENGNYTIKLLVFSENYENATVIMTLEVSQTIFHAIKLNDTKLGKELYAKMIINDPDGIQNISVKLMNAYGEIVDANITIENINNTAKLIEASRFLSVHDSPGKWRIRIIVIDYSNTRTEKMYFVNVRDTELKMKLITPENNSDINSTAVKIIVYIWYEEVRPANDSDITSISATVINEGIIESLKYNGTPGYFECVLTLTSGSHTIKIHTIDASRREASLILIVTITIEQEEHETSNQTQAPQVPVGVDSTILIISLATAVSIIAIVLLMHRRSVLRRTRTRTNVRRI